MIVTWPGHAQLFINAVNRTLLLDPWFDEPVFGGAWFRYPPSPFQDASMFPRPDFLLLSHTHPDHAGLGTLRQLPKDTRVLAIDFASGGMRRRLAKAGLKNVQWVTPFETLELAPGLRVTFVAHHDGWEVASMIVEAEGTRLYHGNDNPLSVAAYQEVVTRVGSIDLAFLPYAGASSYPSGFVSDQQTLAARCAAKKAEGLRRFTDGLEGLRPGEAVPFASSWALLEEGEVEKNFTDRLTADEVLTAAVSKANACGTKLLHMEPGDEWTAEAGVVRKGLSREWTNDVASVRRFAQSEGPRLRAAIQAARGGGLRVSPAVLDAAFERYLGAMLEASSRVIAELKMTVGFATAGGGWRVELVPGSKPVVHQGLRGDEDEVLEVAAAELADLVLGPTTWEDLWYGYRMRVTKRNDTGYFRGLWDMLLGFDDEAISSRLRAELAP